MRLKKHTEEITRNTEALEQVANQIAQDTESGHQHAETLRQLADELSVEVNQYQPACRLIPYKSALRPGKSRANLQAYIETFTISAVS